MGTPIAVMDGLAAWSLADDGKLFYGGGGGGGGGGNAGSGPTLQLAWVSRTGQATPVDPSWTFARGINRDYGMGLSPDGSMAAHREFTADGYNIWVKRLDTGPRWRLTTGDADEKMPVWRPGTRDVTFLSNRGRDFDVWSRREDGTGEAHLILDMEQNLAQIAGSPDGEWLLLRTSENPSPDDRGDIYAYRPGTDSVPTPLFTSEYREIDPAVSPDGRWIAYASDQTGEYQIYVSPFPDVAGGRTLVSISTGRTPTWAPGGRELYFQENGPAGAMMRVDVTTSGSSFLLVNNLFEELKARVGGRG